MWENAEIVVLLDGEGYVRAISRNEEEAAIHDVIGVCILEERILESCKAELRAAFDAALRGSETEVEIGAQADDGLVVWSRAVVKPAPTPDTPDWIAGTNGAPKKILPST